MAGAGLDGERVDATAETTAGETRVRALIVDDHKLFAEALRFALEREGVAVLGIATTGAEALRILSVERPDVVLVDLDLPDQSGLSLGKVISEELPDAKVLAVTALEAPWILKEALREGFDGYITKGTRVPQFINSIRAVVGGQSVFPRRSAGASARTSRGRDFEARLLAEQLTPREQQILSMLARGVSSKEIARRLDIMPNTVRTHVQSILTKLQVHSRLEAVAFAVQNGILSPHSLSAEG